MKKRNELLVVEESAVIKNQECEIPMLTASNGSENYVNFFLIKISFLLLFYHLNYS